MKDFITIDFETATGKPESAISVSLVKYDNYKPVSFYYCTLNLARLSWPKFESYTLTSLAKNFQIVYNAHNALDDALTCGKLVQMAAEEFAPKNSIIEFLEYMGVRINYLNLSKKNEK